MEFVKAGNKPGCNQQNPPQKKSKIVAIYGSFVSQKQRLKRETGPLRKMAAFAKFS
jgi:hypothetical protein